MNRQTSVVLNSSADQFGSRLKPSGVLSDKVTPRSGSPTLMDAKVASLKVLAMTLLNQIESMENGDVGQMSHDLNLHDEVHRFEAAMIKSALTKTGGRQRRAARLLGVKVTTLNTKIKRHKISVAGPADENSNSLLETQSEIAS